MTEKAKGLGQKILIVVGIVVLAYILLKLVFGAVAIVVWLACIAVVALGIIWLASKL